jgi:hypothetical protein
MRLGNVQGNPSVANLGDRSGAIASYAKAKEALEEALRTQPTHRQALLKMGDLLTTSLYLLRADGQLDAALEIGRNAISHWEKIRQFDSQDKNAQSGLAGAYFAMATANELSWDEQMQFWSLAQGVYEEILRSNPADSGSMRNVALVHKYMSGNYTPGTAPNGKEDLDRALWHAEQALKLDEQRVEAGSQDAQARLDLAFSLSVLAFAWEQKNDLKKAIPYAIRSEEIRRTLWEADIKNYQARDRLANALVRTGSLYSKQGDSRNALSKFREAIEHTEALTRISDLQATLDTMAWAHVELAHLHENLRSRESCSQWMRAALAVRRAVDAGKGSSYSNEKQQIRTIDARLDKCGLTMPASDR